MSGLWFLAVCSPAFAYSPRYAAGYSAQSGLGTRVSASCNSQNEILLWPPGPLKRYPAATRYPELSGKRIRGKREESLYFVHAERSKCKNHSVAMVDATSTEIGSGNEWLVVLGGGQSRFCL